MKKMLSACLIAVLLLTAAVAEGGSAPTPKPGRYGADCPQGFMSICGEAVFIVRSGSDKLAKGSSVPWPNDPNAPATGICGRYNPYVSKAVPIKNGKFSYSGTSAGKSYTWTGKWTSRKKMKGTVKWAGCSTKVNYTARWISAG
jgi:hypothetical protein